MPAGKIQYFEAVFRRQLEKMLESKQLFKDDQVILSQIVFHPDHLANFRLYTCPRGPKKRTKEKHNNEMWFPFRKLLAGEPDLTS